MNLDYEIDFENRRVYVLTDGERNTGHSLSFRILNIHKKGLLDLYQERGAIYSIACDYLIDHGYIKER